MAEPLPRSILQLISELARLPTIGTKTAQRLAFFLVRSPESQAISLGRAVASLHEGIITCEQCRNFADENPCAICSDSSREADALCVVEEPLDLVAIESSGGFNGHYHVLHGAISPLDGIGPDDLTINLLIDRVKRENVLEVIVATNATLEGDATAMEIRQRLADQNIRVSRLARGLATGGDLEYVDAATITLALEGRREL
ncbi:MAG TPA: recombination protein RecR [Chloroflexi bacterium]|nr:recombination protein RecR [Chloroflexota bacterium]